MKHKCVFLILCCAFALSACNSAAPEQTPPVSVPAEVSELLQEETAEKESFPIPENAVAAADGIRLIIGRDEEGNLRYGEMLKAGQSLKVHTLGTKLCLVETHSSVGAVPRWEVLLYGERGYSTWKGSAPKGAKVFSDTQLQNEIRSLSRKTRVSVLFSDGQWLYVEINGEYFFMSADDVTANKNDKPEESPNIPDDWTPPIL